MEDQARYGQRKVSKMYAQWDRLRKAIRNAEPHENVEDALDKCEEWIDFAFGKNANGGA